MRVLMTLNPEGVSEAEVAGYQVREAARGVVMDAEGRVALLHVGVHGYYKLPGGGIEAGEDVATAFSRECLEEIGCVVEVTCELGMIVEWRKIFGLKQTSYCFIARVVGAKGEPDFTDGEREDGFELVWMKPTEALAAMQGLVPENPEGRLYIVPRDICLLEAAEALYPEADTGRVEGN